MFLVLSLLFESFSIFYIVSVIQVPFMAAVELNELPEVSSFKLNKAVVFCLHGLFKHAQAVTGVARPAEAAATGALHLYLIIN